MNRRSRKSFYWLKTTDEISYEEGGGSACLPANGRKVYLKYSSKQCLLWLQWIRNHNRWRDYPSCNSYITHLLCPCEKHDDIRRWLSYHSGVSLCLGIFETLMLIWMDFCGRVWRRIKWNVTWLLSMRISGVGRGSDLIFNILVDKMFDCCITAESHYVAAYVRHRLKFARNFVGEFDKGASKM